MTEQTFVITLTDRPPVRIRGNEWPEIAVARGDDYGGEPGAKREQAQLQGEISIFLLRVLQHEDGRMIVYGICRKRISEDVPDRLGGELLEDGDDLISAIRRVGEDCQIPEYVIRKCIADLPPEEL